MDYMPQTTVKGIPLYSTVIVVGTDIDGIPPGHGRRGILADWRKCFTEPRKHSGCRRVRAEGWQQCPNALGRVLIDQNSSGQWFCALNLELMRFPVKDEEHMILPLSNNKN